MSGITPCINIAHGLPKRHQISGSILPSLHFAVHHSIVRAFSICVDFIGFVFVPGSNRVASVDDARRIASVLDESCPSLPLGQTEVGMRWRWHRGSRPTPDRSTVNVHKDKDKYGGGDRDPSENTTLPTPDHTCRRSHTHQRTSRYRCRASMGG
jgi:hypothetical protein